ncbi:MAG: hypothetical protein KDD55_06495 [Bdellovibrionales bacterium]|nr:hypothetical protein [Bdellovibrionales bacterium]
MNKEQERFHILRILPSIPLLLSLFSLSGCFFFSEDLSVSLPLSAIKNENPISPWSLQSLNSSSPYAYQKISSSDGIPEPIYLTAIEDCSTTAPRDLMPSTTRQLLIGFDNVSIEHSEQIERPSGPLLRSLVNATLEGKPMFIVHYALVRNECLVDFVLWTPQTQPASQSEATTPLSDELLGFADQIPLLIDEVPLEGGHARS